ncbi:jg25087, partial [Pararge aegeria aegeria]
VLCTARCNPLGQTACETILPSGTPVCESTPNVLANLGLGLGPLGVNLPPSLILQLLSQSMLPNLGSTTVCDSKTNIGLPVLSPYGLPWNTGIGLPSQTSVCDSTPNISPLNVPIPYGLHIPAGLLSGLNLPGGLVSGLNTPSSTTVCESSSNAISPLGLPLGLSGLPCQRQHGTINGLNLPWSGLGIPQNGLGLPLNGLTGLTVGSLGLPIL